MALGTGNDRYNRAARFWAKIFAINFRHGRGYRHSHGISVRDQLARFSKPPEAVIGPDSRHGRRVLLLPGIQLPRRFPVRREAPRAQGPLGLRLPGSCRLLALRVLSSSPPTPGCSIPTGYRIGAHGEILLSSLWGLLLNPWLLWQYLHDMIGSVITASFVMASVGAFYLLRRRHEESGRIFVRLGVVAGMSPPS